MVMIFTSIFLKPTKQMKGNNNIIETTYIYDKKILEWQVISYFYRIGKTHEDKFSSNLTIFLSVFRHEMVK